MIHCTSENMTKRKTVFVLDVIVPMRFTGSKTHVVDGLTLTSRYSVEVMSPLCIHPPGSRKARQRSA